MPASKSPRTTAGYSAVGASSASPYVVPLPTSVAKPSGRRSASARASVKPFAWMPLDASSTIASPGDSRSPRTSRDFGFTIPMQAPPKSIVSGAITPARAGVSPPPHVAPDSTHASVQPRTRSAARSRSSNHDAVPTAQYAVTTCGSAPTTITSFTIIATVSRASAS
jgi:hypothetical protein